MAAIGCFRGELPTLPRGAVEFTPEGGGPTGFTVHTTTVGLTCPDGELAKLLVVRSDEAPEGPVPVAVVFHSAAFDYVLAPDPEEPLSGLHHAAPGRLDAVFALRHAHATLGMFPDLVEGELHTGSLVTAWLEAGVPVVLPTNCWGDLWGARTGGSSSDFSADFFRREGQTAAEWTVAALRDGRFADRIGASIPFVADPDRIYAVGLGAGGRAVMEVLAIDRDEDGESDLPFAGILLDSSPDDLRAWVDDPGHDLARARGIARIFPDGNVARGSVWGASSLPERIVYLYSSLDPHWPATVHDAAVGRLRTDPVAMVLDLVTESHVVSNGAASSDVVREAIDHLLE